MKKNKILMMVVAGLMCHDVLNASGGTLLPPPPNPGGTSQGGMVQQGTPPAQGPSRGFAMFNRSNQEVQGNSKKRSFLGFGRKDSKRECKDAATLANKAQTCQDINIKKAFMDGSALLNSLCERKPMGNPSQEAIKTAKKLRKLAEKSSNPDKYMQIADSLEMVVTAGNKSSVMGELQARPRMVNPNMQQQQGMPTQQSMGFGPPNANGVGQPNGASWRPQQ